MRFWKLLLPSPPLTQTFALSKTLVLTLGYEKCRWVRRPQRVDCTLNTIKKIKEIKRLPARGSMAIP